MISIAVSESVVRLHEPYTIHDPTCISVTDNGVYANAVLSTLPMVSVGRLQRLKEERDAIYRHDIRSVDDESDGDSVSLPHRMWTGGPICDL